MVLIGVGRTVARGAFATKAAISERDRYSLKVPNRFAFSEFKGYESRRLVAVSNEVRLAVMLVSDGRGVKGSVQLPGL
jgi:hypothetical protein